MPVIIHGLKKAERKQMIPMRLIDEGSALYLTLDIAKLYNGLTGFHEDDYELLIKYKDYIREIHIHDKNKEFGSHQIVGTGVIDFKLFEKFYNENEYLNFEVRPIESAKISKDNLNEIWFK